MSSGFWTRRPTDSFAAHITSLYKVNAMINPASPELRVVRSARRRRTISARRRDGVIEVIVPMGMRASEEAMWVEKMRRRIERAEAGPSDAELARRAAALSRRYFAGSLKPASVRW